MTIPNHLPSACELSARRGWSSQTFVKYATRGGGLYLGDRSRGFSFAPAPPPSTRDGAARPTDYSTLGRYPVPAPSESRAGSSIPSPLVKGSAMTTPSHPIP